LKKERKGDHSQGITFLRMAESAMSVYTVGFLTEGSGKSDSKRKRRRKTLGKAATSGETPAMHRRQVQFQENGLELEGKAEGHGLPP